MNEIVDSSGSPLSRKRAECPRCHSVEKDHVTEKSFGGHLQVICLKCGTRISDWREGRNGTEV